MSLLEPTLIQLKCVVTPLTTIPFSKILDNNKKESLTNAEPKLEALVVLQKRLNPQINIQLIRIKI